MGPSARLWRERIEARQLRHSFALAGFRTDVEQLLPHADLVVNSSYTEGLPVVVLEALAAGVPVVATAVGGTPEVIEDGVQGFLVPAGDPGALARRIEEALANEERRQLMGMRGRQRVQAEFTFQAMGRHYEQVFNRLLGNKSAGHGELGGIPHRVKPGGSFCITASNGAIPQ